MCSAADDCLDCRQWIDVQDYVDQGVPAAGRRSAGKSPISSWILDKC